MLPVKDNPPPFPQKRHRLQASWWVAYTKPRQEKALAWDLQRSSIAYFLPMNEIRRTSCHRSWSKDLVYCTRYVSFGVTLHPVFFNARRYTEPASLWSVMEYAVNG